jgi:hypothetical protein
MENIEDRERNKLESQKQRAKTIRKKNISKR